MPSDLSVRPVSQIVDVRPPANAATPAASNSQSAAKSSTPMYPNPSYRLDPALGMVVIEFMSAGGVVRSSLPTQQQLDAYHRDLDTGSKLDLGGADASGAGVKTA